MADDLSFGSVATSLCHLKGEIDMVEKYHKRKIRMVAWLSFMLSLVVFLYQVHHDNQNHKK